MRLTSSLMHMYTNLDGHVYTYTYIHVPTHTHTNIHTIHMHIWSHYPDSY